MKPGLGEGACGHAHVVRFQLNLFNSWATTDRLTFWIPPPPFLSKNGGGRVASAKSRRAAACEPFGTPPAFVRRGAFVAARTWRCRGGRRPRSSRAGRSCGRRSWRPSARRALERAKRAKRAMERWSDGASDGTWLTRWSEGLALTLFFLAGGGGVEFRGGGFFLVASSHPVP